MSSHTNCLITGANRGLGLALVGAYLSRPNTTVIATVRDPALPSTQAIKSLPKDPSSVLIILKIDSQAEVDAGHLVQTLEKDYSITSLDVVVANAGISLPKAFGPLASLKLADMREHLEVNAIAPFLLFQATLPLLKKSTHGPGKFVGMSSAIGSIGGMEQRAYPMTAYGASKAVLNYLVRKAHFENEDIISFALDPGFVQTDLGNDGAVYFGMKEATYTIPETLEGMVKVIDGATREGTSGKMPIWEGGEFPW